MKSPPPGPSGSEGALNYRLSETQGQPGATSEQGTGLGIGVFRLCTGLGGYLCIGQTCQPFRVVVLKHETDIRPHQGHVHLAQENFEPKSSLQELNNISDSL